jgi:hypothetical protein
MATGQYAKTKAPNKHLILNRIYMDIGRRLKNVDATILLGQYPMNAVKRTAKHICVKFKTIHGYEFNDATWNGLESKGILDRLVETLNKSGKKVKLLLNHTDVMNGKVNRFEDLDFCATWTCSRTNDEPSRKDPISMMVMRLWAQYTYLRGTRAITGTVTLRNGKGKEFSFACLNSLLGVLGWKLKTIGGLEGTYDTVNAKRISRKGTLHNNGFRFHAYEHDLEIERIKPDGAKSVKMRLFTYTDTTPMLTFSIIYK